MKALFRWHASWNIYNEAHQRATLHIRPTIGWRCDRASSIRACTLAALPLCRAVQQFSNANATVIQTMKVIRNGCSKHGKAASCSIPHHATRGQRHVVRGQKQPNREFKGFGSAPKSSSAKPKLPTTAEPKTAADTPGAVDVVTGQTEQQVTAFTSEDTWRQLDEKVRLPPCTRPAPTHANSRAAASRHHSVGAFGCVPPEKHARPTGEQVPNGEDVHGYRRWGGRLPRGDAGCRAERARGGGGAGGGGHLPAVVQRQVHLRQSRACDSPGCGPGEAGCPQHLLQSQLVTREVTVQDADQVRQGALSVCCSHAS
jgi:hypothetical protein